MDTEGDRSASPEYRPRRPHKKSRNGCAQCKKRRIKCNEAKPRCSRCDKMDLPCDYSKSTASQSTGEESTWSDTIDVELMLQESPFFASSPGSTSAATVTNSLFSPATSTFSSNTGTLSTTTSFSERQIQLPRLENKVHLSSLDMELLSHYLRHTSHTMTLCAEDVLAVAVGIPNLALRSVPVMHSLLAVAAVCMARDLLDQRGGVTGYFAMHGRVVELLTVGEDHYRRSVDAVNSLMANLSPQDYDAALVHAYNVCIYGPASHNMRIWLARTSQQPHASPTMSSSTMDSRLSPWMNDWFMAMRSIHLTYNAIIAMRQGHSHDPDSQPTYQPPDDISAGMYYQQALEDEMLRRNSTQQPQAAGHILFPILGATRLAALNILYSKVDALHNLPEYSLKGSEGGWICQCFSALNVLLNISSIVFGSKGGPPPILPPGSGSGSGNGGSTAADRASGDADFEAPADGEAAFFSLNDSDALGFDFIPVGKVPEVSTWWKQFLVRLSGMAAAKPPRRVIMGFLNRVLDTYLALVRRSLDDIRDSPGAVIPREAAAALDVWAHWLVHVLLLNDIWWLGDVGHWELERVVTAFRTRPIAEGWSIEEDYWPESMLQVVSQLAQRPG